MIPFFDFYANGNRGICFEEDETPRLGANIVLALIFFPIVILSWIAQQINQRT